MTNDIDGRYQRHTIAGWDQEKLNKGGIAIVGAGAMANYVCAYLTGLGIGSIVIIENERLERGTNEFLISNYYKKGSYKVDALKQKIELMNGRIKVQPRVSKVLRQYLEKCDVVLDLTNDDMSKRKTRNFCEEINSNGGGIRSVISASASQYKGSIVTYIPKSYKSSKDKLIEEALSKGGGSKRHLDAHFAKLEKDNPPKQPNRANIKEDFEMREFSGAEQGIIPSGAIASLVVEEIRKTLMPLEEEVLLKKRASYNLCSLNRSSIMDEAAFYLPELKNKKVLVIGAGGIGTYVALNTALMGVGSLDIVDGDTIEDHNLNRQILFYGAIDEKKAKVLASRVKEISPRSDVRAIARYYSNADLEKIKPGEYDVIFSCADNFKIRKLLDEHAKLKNIPMINGSVTAFSANMDLFVPGLSNCLGCQYDLDAYIAAEEENDRKKRETGCAAVPQSNVVMSNGIVGAIMVGEFLNLMREDEFSRGFIGNRIEYSSDFGIKASKQRKCICPSLPQEKRCSCHSLSEKVSSAQKKNSLLARALTANRDKQIDIAISRGTGNKPYLEVSAHDKYLDKILGGQK